MYNNTPSPPCCCLESIFQAASLLPSSPSLFGFSFLSPLTFFLHIAAFLSFLQYYTHTFSLGHILILVGEVTYIVFLFPFILNISFMSHHSLSTTEKRRGYFSHNTHLRHTDIYTHFTINTYTLLFVIMFQPRH